MYHVKYIDVLGREVHRIFWNFCTAQFFASERRGIITIASKRS